MAKKKEMDKLSLDMIECEKAGYGCHYGAWKATQDRPVTIEPKSGEIPNGWLVCHYCGKPFKPKTKRPQKYCEQYCQHEAQKEKNREKERTRSREYQRMKRAEERNMRNESYA